MAKKPTGSLSGSKVGWEALKRYFLVTQSNHIGDKVIDSIGSTNSKNDQLITGVDPYVISRP